MELKWMLFEVEKPTTSIVFITDFSDVCASDWVNLLDYKGLAWSDIPMPKVPQMENVGMGNINEEIMRLIHEKCKFIMDIRCNNGIIEVKLPNIRREMCWISIFQVHIDVQEVVFKFLELGGKIE